MNKKLLIILITIFFFLFHTTRIQAHILKTDGTIGALIHIDPDDDPYVGKQSDIFFELKDTTNTFTPQSCDCTVQILQDGIVLSTFSLFTNNEATDLSHRTVTYTFPQKGIYTIKLTGTPKTENSFKAFTITYDIRVSRENTSSPSPDQVSINTYTLLLGSLILVAIVGLFVVYRYTRRITKGNV